MRKGCKLLSTDKLERRLRMMDVKKERVMKMGKLERVLMEKRVTMKMEIAEEELVVERKDWGHEELSRPDKIFKLLVRVKSVTWIYKKATNSPGNLFEGSWPLSFGPPL